MRHQNPEVAELDRGLPDRSGQTSLAYISYPNLTSHLDGDARRIIVAAYQLTMKSFQLVTLFALIAAAMAFAPNQAPQSKWL